jgi:Na+-translocating ferredoxin:NAD+ oxidoreductase RNF subunit RnfB
MKKDKIKKVSVSSAAWGDPYPCGDLTVVYIGGKKVGTCVGGEPAEIRELIEKAYELGFKDGRKEDKQNMKSETCIGTTKCIKSYEKLIPSKKK